MTACPTSWAGTSSRTRTLRATYRTIARSRKRLASAPCPSASTSTAAPATSTSKASRARRPLIAKFERFRVDSASISFWDVSLIPRWSGSCSTRSECRPTRPAWPVRGTRRSCSASTGSRKPRHRRRGRGGVCFGGAQTGRQLQSHGRKGGRISPIRRELSPRSPVLPRGSRFPLPARSTAHPQRNQEPEVERDRV